MGAVAISERDEAVLESLKKTLQIPSKSQVIHLALEELGQSVQRKKLAREIERSVQRCGEADRHEFEALSEAAFHRREK